MALWICTGCTAAYTVGAVRCPQCQSTDYLEADPMPKITVHGGPSNAADDPEPTPEASVPAVEPEPAPEPDTEPTAPTRPASSRKK